MVPLWAAYRAKQYGVALLAELKGSRGQGVSGFVVSSAANERRFEHEIRATSLENFDGFSGDFRPNSISSDHGDFERHTEFDYGREVVGAPEFLDRFALYARIPHDMRAAVAIPAQSITTSLTRPPR